MLVAVLVFIACLLAWWCMLIVVVIWFVGLLVIRLFVVWCGVVGLGFGGFVYLVCFAAFGFGFDTGLLGCLFWFRSFGLCLIISGCCLW